MLKKFEVENYKGFSERLVWNLQAGEYPFNEVLVKNGIVNKAIVYGKNGVGKTSLGLALFDITLHLTDKKRLDEKYLLNYKNLDHVGSPVSFTYVFQFDDNEVIYEYQKNNPDDLVSEKLTVNGNLMVDYDYSTPDRQFVSVEVKDGLSIKLQDNKLSVLKYIYRNRPTAAVPALTSLIEFCENMLWYRTLSDGNAYAGFSNGGANMVEVLYRSGRVKEFQSFLNENGIDYDLRFVPVNGTQILMVVFKDGMTPFTSIASTGTMALFLFFTWKIMAFKQVSLLFIDEFDAFLHYEASEVIIKTLNKMTDFQSVLTSHNTSLMNNRLTRPDCCYIMTTNKVSSLDRATDRELREGHNLEKLYRGGEFYG